VIEKFILFFMYIIRYSCHILIKIEFFDRFQKNTHISNFMKIRPVGAELFHPEKRKEGETDKRIEGQTDMTKLLVAFRNFANATKKAPSF